MDNLAIIADIHSNLTALQKVIRKINELGISKILCAGDIIGYCASPNECCEIVKKFICVKGNHELGVFAKDLSWFNEYARKSILWTRNQLSSQNKLFLSSLPEKLCILLDDEKLVMVHGSPRSVFEYVERNSELLNYFLNETNADILVMAHTHRPFVKKIGKKIVINPGSVGQPRDGNPKASFAIINSNKKCRIIRIKYDVQLTANKIIAAGLPHFLAYRLYYGI